MGNFFASRLFKIILAAVGAAVVLLFVFGLGVFVGYKKASFSYRWGENYHRNFGGPRRGFFQGFGDSDFIESHGTFGLVLKNDNGTLVIAGSDGAEKTVVVNDKTVIRQMTNTLKSQDVKPNDRVLIIGSPNDQGQIEANFIRVFPAP